MADAQGRVWVDEDYLLGLISALEQIASAEEDWTATDAGFSKLQAIAERALHGRH